MMILPKPISFEWDEGNIDKNLVKHNVTNREAEEPFGNKPFLIHKDVKHSRTEERFQALGQTDVGRRLFLSFTIRRSKVRIISARDMNRKERRQYNQID